jgi:hypothetical protein
VIRVDSRFVAGVTLLVLSVAGCADQGSAAPRPAGALPAGTAEASINGAVQGRTNAVSCATTGTVTIVKTGDDSSGTTSSIDSTDGLAVQFVEIRNLGGFTGSHWAGLGPAAEVEMTGGTYRMTGSATGFYADKPSARITQTFAISVAC